MDLSSPKYYSVNIVTDSKVRPVQQHLCCHEIFYPTQFFVLGPEIASYFLSHPTILYRYLYNIYYPVRQMLGRIIIVVTLTYEERLQLWHIDFEQIYHFKVLMMMTQGVFGIEMSAFFTIAQSLAKS